MIGANKDKPLRIDGYVTEKMNIGGTTFNIKILVSPDLGQDLLLSYDLLNQLGWVPTASAIHFARLGVTVTTENQPPSNEVVTLFTTEEIVHALNEG